MTDPASRLPDYDLLATLLRESGAEMSPAEAHGVLTGALCAPGDAEPAWRRLILESDEEAASAALFEQLEELKELTRALLEGSEFDFEPLLPGEEAGLSGQLAGFTDWCRGFLLGLAAGGLPDPRALSAEVTEFLQDVVQMSEAELEAGARTQRARSARWPNSSSTCAPACRSCTKSARPAARCINSSRVPQCARVSGEISRRSRRQSPPPAVPALPLRSSAPDRPGPAPGC